MTIKAIRFSVYLYSILYIDVCMFQPVEITPVVIISSSTSNVCLSVESQAARQLLQTTVDKFITQSECGPGHWREAFYVNASEPDQSCLGNWSVLTSRMRGCAGANYQCSSAFSGDINTPYSKVCSRIIGEGVMLPDAFSERSSRDHTIERNYLDGVSVTHGASGSRTHIWSLGAGHSATNSEIARCPCVGPDK